MDWQSGCLFETLTKTGRKFVFSRALYKSLKLLRAVFAWLTGKSRAWRAGGPGFEPPLVFLAFLYFKTFTFSKID